MKHVIGSSMITFVIVFIVIRIINSRVNVMILSSRLLNKMYI